VKDPPSATPETSLAQMRPVDQEFPRQLRVATGQADCAAVVISSATSAGWEIMAR
jgi:hypothetical protein